MPLNVGRGLCSTDNFQNLIDSSLDYPDTSRKFHQNLFITFCVKLFTDKQTNRQTNASKDSISLAEIIMIITIMTITTKKNWKKRPRKSIIY